MADDPPFAVMAFVDLDDDQLRRIESMPRWLSTVRMLDASTRTVVVNVRRDPGDVSGDIAKELNEWLDAHDLPEGRLLPMYSA